MLIERSLTHLSAPSLQVMHVTGLLALAPFRSEVIAGALDIEPATVRRLLGELVSFGLLIKESGNLDYAVTHRLIYTHIGHKYSPESVTTARLAAYYRNFSRTQEKEGQKGYALLNDHRAHIMQVLSVCEQQHLWQSLTDMVRAIENYLDLQGYRSDQITAIERGLKASKELKDKGTEGDFLGNLGLAYYSLGQVKKAIDLYNQAILIMDEIKSPNAEIFRKNLDLLEAEGE